MMTSLQETEYVCTTLDLAIVPPLEVVETDSNLFAMFVAVARVYHTAALVDPIVHRWGLASWALDLTVNGLGTLAIAGRLWWIGRRSACSKSGGRNSYLGVAIIVLESGAMFTFATFVLVILYVNTPTAQVSAAFTSIVAQIAVLSPLLIILRVWLNVNHGSSQTTTPIARLVTSCACHGSNQITGKGVNYPTLSRTPMPQTERVNFPGERRKEQCETDNIDSYQKTAGSSFAADFA
ncbi:hypothetical protein NLI96_g12660 [Meripilus lineatus]|uniref:Transmembrane protein n=1 Tax=Meripilus lineatus TaxID=2056292 RepID=A0AAD5URW5_9APHY|nr:hypothetical protein NLI96_g12660 [Physisporinus lineatus]